MQGRLNATPALARWVAINVNAGVNSDGNSGRPLPRPASPRSWRAPWSPRWHPLSAKRWEEVRTASDTLYKALQALRSARGETDPSSSLLGLEKPYLIEINFRKHSGPCNSADKRRASPRRSNCQQTNWPSSMPSSRLVYEDPSLQRLVMVQLAQEILRALPEDRRAALKSRFQGKDVDLSVIGPTELEAVATTAGPAPGSENSWRSCSKDCRTLNHNGFNLERLKEISAGLKDA